MTQVKMILLRNAANLPNDWNPTLEEWLSGLENEQNLL